MEGNRVYLAACPDYGQAEAKLWNHKNLIKKAIFVALSL